MLHKQTTKLELNHVLFTVSGIRGGISQCCNRYSAAYNEYMQPGYDPNQPSKYIMYWNLNNLFGWAMMQNLPYGGFQWAQNVDQIDFLAVPDGSPVGFLLEVDLHYPEAIYDDHKHFLFCPFSMAPPQSQHLKVLIIVSTFLICRWACINQY